MLRTSISENIEENKRNEKVEDSQGKVDRNKPLLQNINTPFNLNKIHPRPAKVCKCDEIGFDTNGKWNRKYVLTNYFQMKECGRCKQESGHHYGAHYLYLTDLMVNDSLRP